MTLPTDEQILIVREFDAPRELLYRAWTTPDLLSRWWSGSRGGVKSVEIDLRVGGGWRYAMVTDEGAEVAFRGRDRDAHCAYMGDGLQEALDLLQEVASS